jgi:hypothetical protein
MQGRTVAFRAHVVTISVSFGLQADLPDPWLGNTATTASSGCGFMSSLSYCLVLSSISFRSSSQWVFYSLLKVPTTALRSVPTPLSLLW